MEDAIEVNNAVLQAFLNLVRTHDYQSGLHCERVATNAYTLGSELGLPEVRLRRLYWAGLLHDVGKVVLPKEVLLKADRLTTNELLLVREHPNVGARLLMGISNELEEVASGIGSHHERWDGTGYPRGLQGASIPLFGRILAVVDAFEAMTTKRPYKRASTPEQALSALRDGAGTQFDPGLVLIYERLYREGRVAVAGHDGPEAIKVHETLWDAAVPNKSEVTAVGPADSQVN